MSDATPTPSRRPRRFGWGMRLFLSFLIFDMVFRSMSVLYPWAEWVKELDMRRQPLRLSTREEFAKLRAQATADNPTPVTDDVLKSLDSVWDFFKPWPETGIRNKLRTWEDVGKWSLAWMCTRLDFFENVVGFNNEWPMFSPSVGKRKYVARARLLYEDGSEEIIRSKGDPEDLTRYSHWWEEKILDHELKIKQGRSRIDEAWGYCHLLSHRHAYNANGSPLKQIALFEVRLDLPEPGVDAHAWYAELNRAPSRIYPDFYVFDVKTRHGTHIGKDDDD